MLDSSAVLALLLAERGADVVAASLPGALLSAVSLAEAVSRLAARGMPALEARAAVEAVGIEIVDFDADQACLCADMARRTEGLGLTLAARACLTLARLRSLPAVTADPAWRVVPGVEVRLIREPVEPEPVGVDTRPSWLRGL